MGSGTTLAVALKHGRRGIGLELNPDYINLAHDRISKSQPLLFALEAAL
jgi:DNA modification methylase